MTGSWGPSRAPASLGLLDPGKRANHLFHFSIQPSPSATATGPNQAVALLANPVFVVLPLRQVCLVNVQQLRKLRLVIFKYLRRNLTSSPCNRYGWLTTANASVRMRSFRRGMTTSSFPHREHRQFRRLAAPRSQPTLREWVTPSNYAGGRAASGAFSLPHFSPLLRLKTL